MSRKKPTAMIPGQLPDTLLRASATDAVLVGSILDEGGGGCQNYAYFKLEPGIRIVSDDVLRRVLAQARQEGYDKALADIERTLGAISEMPT